MFFETNENYLLICLLNLNTKSIVSLQHSILVHLMSFAAPMEGVYLNRGCAIMTTTVRMARMKRNVSTRPVLKANSRVPTIDVFRCLR